MSEQQSDDANLDDVLQPTEQAVPDHREHAKTAKHLNDDELERRSEHEREVVAADRSADDTRPASE